MTRILALDLATVTGWCSGEADERPILGHFRLPSTGDDVGRFLDAAIERLSGLIEAEEPAMVCFEAPILPRQTSLTTVRKLHGLAGVAEWVCMKRGVSCFEVAPSIVKKHMTGSGAAKKPQMVAAARAMGFEPAVEDEADALGVWLTVVRTRFPRKAARIDPLFSG